MMINPPTIFVRMTAPAKGLNSKINPHNVLMIEIIIVTFHIWLWIFFNSNAYCNFIALFIIMPIPIQLE